MAEPLISSIVVDGEDGLSIEETLESIYCQQHRQIELIVATSFEGESGSREALDSFFSSHKAKRFTDIQVITYDSADTWHSRTDLVIESAKGDILCPCRVGDVWTSSKVFDTFAESLSSDGSVEGVCFGQVVDAMADTPNSANRMSNLVTQMLAMNDRWSLRGQAMRTASFPVMGAAFSKRTLERCKADGPFESTAFAWAFFYQLVFSEEVLRFAGCETLLAKSPDFFFDEERLPSRTFYKEAGQFLESVLDKEDSFLGSAEDVDRTKRTYHYLVNCESAFDKGISILLPLESSAYAKAFLSEFFKNPLPETELIVLCPQDDEYTIIDATNDSYIKASWCKRIKVINKAKFTRETSYPLLLEHASRGIIVYGDTKDGYQGSVRAALEAEDTEQVRLEREAAIAEEKPLLAADKASSKETAQSGTKKRRMSSGKLARFKEISESQSIAFSITFTAIAALALALMFLSGASAYFPIVVGIVAIALVIELLFLVVRLLASAILMASDD